MDNMTKTTTEQVNARLPEFERMIHAVLHAKNIRPNQAEFDDYSQELRCLVAAALQVDPETPAVGNGRLYQRLRWRLNNLRRQTFRQNNHLTKVDESAGDLGELLGLQDDPRDRMIAQNILAVCATLVSGRTFEVIFRDMIDFPDDKVSDRLIRLKMSRMTYYRRFREMVTTLRSEIGAA